MIALGAFSIVQDGRHEVCLPALVKAWTHCDTNTYLGWHAATISDEAVFECGNGPRPPPRNGASSVPKPPKPKPRDESRFGPSGRRHLDLWYLLVDLAGETQPSTGWRPGNQRKHDIRPLPS